MDSRPNSKRTEEEVVAYYSEIRRYADEAGVVIGQTHAAFGPVGVYTGDLRAEMMKATINAIIATSVLGAPYIVIHPLNILGRLFDEQLEECRELNREFFAELVPYLKKYNVKVGMENMWGMDKGGVIRPCVCSRPEEILEYIGLVDADCFCACPDLGHFVLTGNDTGDTPAGAIRKLGNQVKLIHAHEVDGAHDNHSAPYDFAKPMDWNGIADALRDVNYEGTLNFEIGGYYYDRFPDELVPEALRHVATIGEQMIARIEA
jgi:sugar phosphate isomerase/epimerase